MSVYKKQEKSCGPLDFVHSNPSAGGIKKLLKCRGAGIKCGRLVRQETGLRVPGKGAKEVTRYKNRKEADTCI